jgi:hypothetical protein
MKDIEMKINQLRDQTWQIARESLDSGETRIYRTLTDIAEKLTKLVSSSDKSQIDVIKTGRMIPIFARYKGERYEAELDVDRIDGGRRPCVLMEGRLWTAAGAVRHITNTSVNGWRHFWRYIDESTNSEQPIDRLRENN